jgi:hypothetical protein
MKLRLVMGALMTLALAGCAGEQVTIQSGEVAKQLTAKGMEEGLRNPSSFRLDYCGATQACPRIVRLQVGRSTAEVKIDSLLLPKSNVDVTNITVGFQWRVRATQAQYNRIFADVSPAPVQGKSVEMLISSEMVWNTYGRRKAQAAVADAFNDLNVDQAIGIGTSLSAFVKAKVDAAMADTPIEIVELDVSNTDVSDEVIKAKRALFAIEDAKTRRILELQANQAIEQQRQAFQVLRAKNDQAIAESLGMTSGQYMCLKTMERLADAADDKNSTVVINGDCGLSVTTTSSVLPLRSQPAPQPQQPRQ